MDDEHPVERKKSRWSPPRRGAVRIFPALRAVGALLFIAVGALLFVVGVYYVANLNRKVLLVLGAATVVAAVAVLIRVGQRYEWTGFGESVQPKADNQEIQPRACYELGRKSHRNADSTIGLVTSRSPFPAFLSRF
jgi:hypothetical protein